jgi:hypothetical protein
MKCPRRVEGPLLDDTDDKYREDDTCSYCGSLNPETFMARLEAGDMEVGPTDKSYKVYLENRGGANFKMSHRQDCDCVFERGLSGAETLAKVEACPHWVTGERSHSKFYFQHLSSEQQRRFIELLNAGKLKIGVPGYFYRTPFFIKRVTE